jgi:hypothetical protein
MDDATLAQLLDTYNSHNYNISLQLPQQELSFSAENVAQGGDSAQRCTKAE